MNRTLYTKTELRVLREIMNKVNKKEKIYILKRKNEIYDNNDIYVSFNGICEIKACSEWKFPFNIDADIFTKTDRDPIARILNEKKSDEIDIYFSTPKKSGICEILPNAAGVEKIGIDGKKSAFLGKDCRFKLFATEEYLYYSVYDEFDKFIGIFCPALLTCLANIEPEAKKMIKYSEAAKTAQLLTRNKRELFLRKVDVNRGYIQYG